MVLAPQVLSAHQVDAQPIDQYGINVLAANRQQFLSMGRMYWQHGDGVSNWSVRDECIDSMNLTEFTETGMIEYIIRCIIMRY